jgi:glycosyltransferase involved in cell wall biosynthesis
MVKSHPLVSVVTPMYNEEDHLADCIDSIVAQTYSNWELIIVDNCSTDRSLEIAWRYAAKDSRIRVVEGRTCIRALANHNRALEQISPESKYCKVVFADDTIVPECLERMVTLAEEYPSVGIVGAYGIEGARVMWTGIPYPTKIVDGRELCRSLFLDGLYVFGTSTSLLYRAEVVRQNRPFFNESNLHGDSEACVAALKTWDFGFVHQVLTISRLRPRSLRTRSEEIDTYSGGKLRELVAHGRAFLNPEEYEMCLRRCVAGYYNNLAGGLFRRRGADFWRYHIAQLRDCGVPFSKGRLAVVVLGKVFGGALNPGAALASVCRIAGETFARSRRTPASQLGRPHADSRNAKI